MCMCNGICRDILMFATMWGEVPKISEILEPSKALKQVLLGLSPLSLIPIRHKWRFFFRGFLQGGCMYLFMWVIKKNKKILKTQSNMRNSS